MVDTSLFTISPLELILKSGMPFYLNYFEDVSLCGVVVFTSEVWDSNDVVISPEPSHVTLVDTDDSLSG